MERNVVMPVYVTFWWILNDPRMNREVRSPTHLDKWRTYAYL
jgi:hypothetical protein